MINDIPMFLLPVGMLVTLVALGAGLYAMARGGIFSKIDANKMMRLRVAAQAVTIALLMIISLIASRGAA